jgi:hypothetical protein
MFCKMPEITPFDPDRLRFERLASRQLSGWRAISLYLYVLLLAALAAAVAAASAIAPHWLWPS